MYFLYESPCNFFFSQEIYQTFGTPFLIRITDVSTDASCFLSRVAPYSIETKNEESLRVLRTIECLLLEKRECQAIVRYFQRGFEQFVWKKSSVFSLI